MGAPAPAPASSAAASAQAGPGGAPLPGSRARAKALNPGQSGQALSAVQERAGEYASWSGLRCGAYWLVTAKSFSHAILGVVLFNTLVIALQTEPASSHAFGWYLTILDNICNGIFLFELCTKLYVYRKKYFASRWNIFDMVIILSSFLDYLQYLASVIGNLNPKVFRVLRVLRALRALRALRVLRTITFFRSLQMIVQTLLKSIPALSSIVLLLGLAFIFLNLFIAVIVNNLQSNQHQFRAERRRQERKRRAEMLAELRRKQLFNPDSMDARKRKVFKQFPAIDRTIEDYYAGDPSMTTRKKQLLERYLQLLAALESNHDFYQNQQQALDDLVDMMVLEGM
eukprot:jgi/Chlat1/3438/Chrsp23S03822